MFIVSTIIALKRHYPNFNHLLNCIPDHRKKCTYVVAEIIMAGLQVFIFKRGSRNNADNGVHGNFEENYIKLFGLRLPVMDTVHTFLKELPPTELEQLKKTLIHQLIERKVLSKYRFNNRYIVAVDGTGMFSFDYEPFPGCPHKTSKNGKITWQAYVLEAKILACNGFSISIATEWLKNSEDIGQKQDCELKAFNRLAQKLKNTYPRLPIIIVADSLYPNKNIFALCQKNNWSFILTFKEGRLKSVWDEVSQLYELEKKNNKIDKPILRDKKGWLYEHVMFLNNLEYDKFNINWIEYTKAYLASKELEARFVHVTDIQIKIENAFDISKYGRLRWKIENEGFNTQKNGGYKLQHKYARKNLFAMQNYYQLLQIAHLIIQLTEKLQKVKQALAESGRTIRSVWEDLIATMLKDSFIVEDLMAEINNVKQLRY